MGFLLGWPGYKLGAPYSLTWPCLSCSPQMATPLAPAWFVLCWQCVLPGRIVAKGQWLWRLGGAPAVTLTVPNGRARRDSTVLSLAAPSTHCAAPDTAMLRPGIEPGPAQSGRWVSF